VFLDTIPRIMTNGSVDYLNLLDDFGISTHSNKEDTTHDTSLLAIVFFLQTLVCFGFNGLCVAYLVGCQKYKHSSKYNILAHYFSFKLAFALVLLTTLLMSSVFEDTSFHVAPSNWRCKCEFFANMFMETCENYLLFFLWLVLLAERDLIGFKCLNIEKTGLPLDSSPVPDTSLRKWCRKHSSGIFLVKLLDIDVGSFTAIGTGIGTRIGIGISTGISTFIDNLISISTDICTSTGISTDHFYLYWFRSFYWYLSKILTGILIYRGNCIRPMKTVVLVLLLVLLFKMVSN
jgi:hypothetical protein